MSSDQPIVTGKVRSIDGIVTSRFAKEPTEEPTRKKTRFRPHAQLRKRGYVVLTGLCVALILGGITYWRLLIWQPAVVDPFTPTVSSSVNFPLYYPTSLPAGFRIDRKSVYSPQTGVIVFSLVGPQKAKLYISEEARPNTFNLGGFYNSFQGLKEVGAVDGAIAVGRASDGKTEVASRANNQTWILCDIHNGNIPLDTLIDMLKSIVHA